MICKDVLRLLLAAERPDRPSPEVRQHLAGCGSCRKWHRRLIRVEQQIPLLPVPATTARERVLAQLAQLHQEPAATVPIAAQTAAHPSVRSRRLMRIRYVVASAAGLAAAAVLFAMIGWWVFPPGGTGTTQAKRAKTDPMLASLVQHNVRLAKAGTATERIRELAELADVLESKTRDLAEEADATDLEELAKLYEKVVRDGVVGRAKDLPLDQRREVLDPILGRLAKTEADAKRQASDMPESSAQPLLLIASAAHNGHGDLQDLMQEVPQ